MYGQNTRYIVMNTSNEFEVFGSRKIHETDANEVTLVAPLAHHRTFHMS